MPKPIAVREDYLDVARANLSAAIRELTSAAVFTDRAGQPQHTESINTLIRHAQTLRLSLDEEEV